MFFLETEKKKEEKGFDLLSSINEAYRKWGFNTYPQKNIKNYWIKKEFLKIEPPSSSDFDKKDSNQ
ncbi:MAG: hypothetical protein CEE43_17035 [Promethearchaeota archaeon Loki_b32]|nr:MAG: hypothetical protein CEE43_17035 [Candidatus Lokiarchaeota archaeon Loki_b32]